MKKKIEIEAYVDYLLEEDEKKAEVLTALIQRKLSAPKYRKKILEIIIEAQKEVGIDLSLLKTLNNNNSYGKTTL